MLGLKVKLDLIAKKIADKQKKKYADEVHKLQKKFIEVLMHREEVKIIQDKLQNSINSAKRN